MLNLITATGQGQLLETMIANQLQHYGQVSYYNKRNTAEIDFILNNEIAFEVKQKAVIQDLHKLEKLAVISVSHNTILSVIPSPATLIELFIHGFFSLHYPVFYHSLRNLIRYKKLEVISNNENPTTSYSLPITIVPGSYIYNHVHSYLLLF